MRVGWNGGHLWKWRSTLEHSPKRPSWLFICLLKHRPIVDPFTHTNTHTNIHSYTPCEAFLGVLRKLIQHHLPMVIDKRHWRRSLQLATRLEHYTNYSISSVRVVFSCLVCIFFNIMLVSFHSYNIVLCVFVLCSIASKLCEHVEILGSCAQRQHGTSYTQTTGGPRKLAGSRVWFLCFTAWKDSVT